MDNLQSAILSRFTSAMPTPIRLRDLIRQIRSARTAADERAVVQKECAYIRSTFREDDNVWRCRNVAKLLYIHMLGYPAHFGQLECLKLIASSRYTDKRIGYLGAMLLLDERQDVHLLITNSLKNDLNSSQQFVVGLALCCLGSICSSEMSRDLLEEVERLMKSQNSYIKKKAALCAARIVRKLPDLSEMFMATAKGFLSDKNHGCLIAAVSLITEMCELNSEALAYYKKNSEFTINLVRILKNLIMSGFSPEHDVSSVSDPFLQVKLLRLLRILGRNDEVTSEIMNDILAQVATNTESNKNVGNAILYETVISIMEIKSETGLRVLGVNILGRFLLNTDKNIRYVALTTLLKSVQVDYNAVQRHRTTIVECLKDQDVSIRKKAMELCFALINKNNIKTLSKELIMFLEKSDPEFKSICSSNLCISAEKFSPDPKWHIDTVIKILTTSGNYVRDDVVGQLIELISSYDSLHSYAVCQLWQQLTGDLATKQPLVQVCLWGVGEFADLLVQGLPEHTDGEIVETTEADIVSMCEKLLNTNHMTLITKEYTISALIKLSVRFPQQCNRVKQIIDVFGSDHNIELQQRAVEFGVLFNNHDKIRASVLEKMPQMTRNSRRIEAENDQSAVNGTLINGDSGVVEEYAPSVQDNSSALMDLLNLSPTDVLPVSPVSSSVLNTSGTSNVLDLLDILDNESVVNTESVPPTKANDILGLFDAPEKSIIPDPTLPLNGNATSFPLDDDDLLGTSSHSKIPSLVSFDKNGLKIVFDFEKSIENPLQISLTAQNTTDHPMEEFLFQAAVPKSFQLQLLPPSSACIPPNGSLSQVIKVTNPNKTQLKMRLRISYKHNGQSVLEQTDVTNFPPETWQSL